MKPDDMAGGRVLLAGTGAIGGYVAAHLARTGAPVVALDAWSDNVAAIRQHGIRVEGLTTAENFNIPLRTLHVGDVAALGAEPAFDVVLLCVKSYDTA
jgi:2-dehydropantoate 2-reductase